jgi:hypothetical protein
VSAFAAVRLDDAAARPIRCLYHRPYLRVMGRRKLDAAQQLELERVLQGSSSWIDRPKAERLRYASLGLAAVWLVVAGVAVGLSGAGMLQPCSSYLSLCVLLCSSARCSAWLRSSRSRIFARRSAIAALKGR